jgi:murein DD-endopeptidase MepM/ murein hydrolase activator NlpD
MIFVYPVPRLGSRPPKISSGFHTADRPSHHGVDIMYKRLPEDEGSPGKHRLPTMSPGHFMPSGIPALAFAGGVVATSKQIGTGGYVEIRHVGGVASEYMHLASRRVKVGDTVRAGQPIGIVGYGKEFELNHLHFQLRQDGELLDPKPTLAQAVVVDNPLRFRALMAIAALGVGAWALHRAGVFR